MYNPQTVLVTGIAGGVGRAMAAWLDRSGHRVVGLARPEDDIDGVCISSSSIVRGYVEDPVAVEEAMRGCDAVVNCAALLPNALSKVDDSAFHRVNTMGSVTVLEQAIKHGVKKAFFCSTISVADHIFSHVTSDNLEAFVTDPHDAYLKSKIETEKQLRALSPKFEGELHVIRPAFIYGPRNFATWADALELIRNGKMSLIGSGEISLPLIFADDIAEFVSLALDLPFSGPSYQIHILSNPEPTTMALVFDYIAEFMEFSRPKRIPYFIVWIAAEVLAFVPKAFLFGRLKLLTKARVQQYSRGYDMSGVNTSPLGYTPRTSFRTGMLKMVEDYFQRSKPHQTVVHR